MLLLLRSEPAADMLDASFLEAGTQETPSVATRTHHVCLIYRFDPEMQRHVP